MSGTQAAQLTRGSLVSTQSTVVPPRQGRRKGTDSRIIEQGLRDAQAICCWSLKSAPGEQGGPVLTGCSQQRQGTDQVGVCQGRVRVSLEDVRPPPVYPYEHYTMDFVCRMRTGLVSVSFGYV